MGKLLSRAHSINTLRKALGFGKVFEAIKFDYSVQYTAKVDFKNALILAPHPDDESFGMGGTIKKMTTAGSTAQVAYFTDGSKGVPIESLPENVGEVKVKRNPALIDLRKEEAQKACQILGVKETHFWGYQDSQLAASHSAMKALSDLIERVKPDIIFLPSFLDNHPDHRAANEIFINAVSGLPRNLLNFEVWAYEVWIPIFINRLVDISLYIKTKEEAMKSYQTQLATRRYDKAIMALNQYRAEISNSPGFGEGFFASSIDLYKELYEKS